MTTPTPRSLGNTDTVAVTVAANVRAELGRHRKTYTDLAAHLGIGKQTVSARMSGSVPFDVVELASIAKWLQVDVTVFLPPTGVVA